MCAMVFDAIVRCVLLQKGGEKEERGGNKEGEKRGDLPCSLNALRFLVVGFLGIVGAGFMFPKPRNLKFHNEIITFIGFGNT